MGADAPIPPNTIERRRPSNGRPRGGFSDNKYLNLLAPPCLVEAMRRHKQNFSNLSYPYEAAMNLFYEALCQSVLVR